MPKHRSDKSRFESRYGGGFISKAQWLAEYICERQALQAREALPVRFWNLPRWDAEFKKQLTQANRLLKEYDAAAVSRALRSPKAKTVYSLGAPHLKPLVQQEQVKLDRERKAQEEAPPTAPAPKTDAPVRPVFVPKSSQLSKLKGL